MASIKASELILSDDLDPLAEFRSSFFYGSRSNLNFKFLRDLSNDEFGDFIEELFDSVAHATDTGDAKAAVDVAYKWQVHAYVGHLGDPANFPHRHEDTPIATMNKPLSEAKVALLTSSGHFVDGDDPEPFGEKDMTQAEAEARIGDFLRAAPLLSSIPIDTPHEQLRVRHGGYPIQGALIDSQVALPLAHLRALEAEGVVGELAPNAYSFVGAASQLRLQRSTAPAWADQLKDQGVDAVLLVPV